MKKLWLIVIVCLLVGCNSEVKVDEQNEEISDRPTEVVSVVNQADYLSFTGNKGDKYFENKAWTVYIKDKYNVDIKLDYDHNDSDSIVYLNYFDNSSSMNYMYSNYANKEDANDLTKYYEQYNFSQYFNNDYLPFVSDDDGIYAIPVINNGKVYPRYYKSDILEKGNLSLPRTADDFFEYLMVSKELNSENTDYTPLYINSGFVGQSLSDVFRSFGVFLGGSTTYYNPVTKSIENAMFSEGIYEAGNYIHLLLENDLLYIHGQDFTMDDELNITRWFNDEKYPSAVAFASEYKYIINSRGGYSKSNPEYEYETGYYLNGTNNKYVVEIEKKVAFYVFPKTISNMDSTISLFNKIMTDDKYIYDFKYGIEGVDYIIENNNLIPKEPEYGNYMGLRLINPIISYDQYERDESLSIVDTLAKDQAYEITTFHELLGINREFVRDETTNNTPFKLLFIEDVSIVDAVEEYRRIFKQNGGTDIISAMNTRLGTTSSYDYN